MLQDVTDRIVNPVSPKDHPHIPDERALAHRGISALFAASGRSIKASNVVGRHAFVENRRLLHEPSRDLAARFKIEYQLVTRPRMRANPLPIQAHIRPDIVWRTAWW
jgi:hypothetical protein